jgi:hypothetical protein
MFLENVNGFLGYDIPEVYILYFHLCENFKSRTVLWKMSFYKKKSAYKVVPDLIISTRISFSVDKQAVRLPAEGYNLILEDRTKKD